MVPPAATIVIPTYRRPVQVATAVESALGQSIDDAEVLVVDDASPEPVTLADHPRLRVIHLDRNGGTSAARNVGLAEATGRFITYLDDDDRLLPDHLAASLEAIERSSLPGPVASLTGTEVVSDTGEVLEQRMAPTLPRGSDFSLEPLQPGCSYATKAAFVVEVDVLRAIGAWDEAFRSRVQTELFLRLNPACSIQGVPVLGYQRVEHTNERVSDDPVRRAASMRQLEAKHRDAFRRHPERHADMLFHQAMRLWKAGGRRPALEMWASSVRAHPPRALGHTAGAVVDRARWSVERRRS